MRSRSYRRLLDLIRELDAREGWNTGFGSCAAWLSWRVGLDLGAARERVWVTRVLGMLPRLAQAMARGELSYAKVRALTRVATPQIEERRRPWGAAGTADQVERIVRGWRRMDRKAEAAETAKTAREPRAARVSGRGRHGDCPGAGSSPRSARCSCRPSPRLARLCMGKLAGSTRRPARPTRSRCSPRRHSTTASIPARRPSDIRSSRIRMSPGSLSSRTVHTFPRKRRGAWRATRAGW